MKRPISALFAMVVLSVLTTVSAQNTKNYITARYRDLAEYDYTYKLDGKEKNYKIILGQTTFEFLKKIEWERHKDDEEYEFDLLAFSEGQHAISINDIIFKDENKDGIIDVMVYMSFSTFPKSWESSYGLRQETKYSPDIRLKDNNFFLYKTQENSQLWECKDGTPLSIYIDKESSEDNYDVAIVIHKNDDGSYPQLSGADNRPVFASAQAIEATYQGSGQTTFYPPTVSHSSNIPSVKVDKIWVDHNVKETLDDNQEHNGMVVHMSVSFFNCKDCDCSLWLYAYSDAERRNSIGGLLPEYRDENGSFCYQMPTVPPYEECYFEDATMYIPYDAFQLREGHNNVYLYGIFLMTVPQKNVLGDMMTKNLPVTINVTSSESASN